MGFLDIYMPEGDGISTLQQLRAKGYTMPVLMLSMTADKKYVDTSMEQGQMPTCIKVAMHWK
jgi:response regulator of citrate/malate metabolism